MFYWGYLLDWNQDGKIFSEERTQRLNKILPPHYLKHPTEDRTVTWPQWKHAQLAVIRDQEYLYKQMFFEHSLLARALVWMSREEDRISALIFVPLEYVYKRAVPRIKQFIKNARNQNGANHG